MLVPVWVACHDATGDSGADAGTDASAAIDGGRLDASGALDSGGRDAAADAAALDATTSDSAIPDSGLPMLCSRDAMLTPAPAEPACTAEQSACYRACVDLACILACRAMLVAPPDCFDCQANQYENCILRWCGAQYQARDCCETDRCPSGGACPECAAERDAMSACESLVFVPHCQPLLQACLLPS